MPRVIFSHPVVDQTHGTLHVNTGTDDISWGYNLNTQTFPTYGGEVVQILSIFSDDMEVHGTLETYEQLERITKWFLAYMQIATQGGNATPAYNQDPVTMLYQARGWDWKIVPKAFPGFRYSREVVAPEWRLQAHVVDEEEEIKELNIQAAMEGLERVSPGIGYREVNPFSDPFALDEKFEIKDLGKYYDKVADGYSGLIKKYMEKDYESLFGEIGAKPAFLRRGTGDEDGTQEESGGQDGPNAPSPGRPGRGGN